MDNSFYSQLTSSSLSDSIIDRETCLKILSSTEIELLPLINASYQIRKKYYKKDILLHILNNVQNGKCPEDCSYCAQSKSSSSKIEEYSMKSEEEILEEARIAYEKGAFRYCMVFSGTGPSQKRIETLSRIIKKIKSKYELEVCVSPGIIDTKMALSLKESGLDRLNHNLNTSENLYPKICTSHSYTDRLNTLHIAKEIDLQICSGIIIGMGESPDDIIDMAMTLKKVNADSIPINFYIPIEGTNLKASKTLTPEFCLRVLCLFRFLNPKADLRVAAGREIHLRDLQQLAFYPANSVFLNGYLNAKGSNDAKTLQMLKDSGFNIKSEYSLDDLLLNKTDHTKNIELKHKSDLRPAIK